MSCFESTGVSLRVLIALACLLTAAAAWADVHGRITFNDPLPARPVADRALDPACGGGAASDDPLLVSDAGGVQNAVVRLVSAGSNSAAASVASLPPVVIRQKGCSYVPRVQAARRGQAIVVENQDPLLHNLHAFAGRKGLFNVAQPAGSAPVRRDLAGVDVLRLKCDIHPWMFGWVVFSDSPYYAVTGPDGRFAIPDVPPGTYTLSVWHETLGTREVQIKVPQGSLEANVDLTPRR